MFLLFSFTLVSHKTIVKAACGALRPWRSSFLQQNVQPHSPSEDSFSTASNALHGNDTVEPKPSNLYFIKYQMTSNI